MGGHRVKREELCSCFEAIGLSAVDTFRASGNVVFEAAGDSQAAMTIRVQESLAASLGYEVLSFLRTAREVRAIAEHEPFGSSVLDASAGKLQVVMHSARPAKRVLADVLALAGDGDVLAPGEREIYWLPEGGQMESALDLKALGTLLGPVTIRTKGTMQQLAAKYFSG